MIYLIIDTNIWLYLANGLDTSTGKHSDDQHFMLLKELKKLKENNDICILVNEIIYEEWERNKNVCQVKIEKLKQKLQNPEEHFRELRKYVKSDTKGIQKEYVEGIETEIKANENHIREVENFLYHDCINVHISDKLKIEIFNLSVQKKAPFHNKKNNIADACILLSARDYIKTISFTKEDSILFVSNNYDDFTNGKDKENFHPEIIGLLGTIDISYERILPKALKISKAIIAELEEYHEHEKWLESVLFLCRTPWCENHKEFTPWGYLDETIVVKYESDEQIDPNQLELFPEMPRLKRDEINVGIGNCILCETLHLECPNCGAITYVDNYNDEFECIECFTRFKLKQDTEGKSFLLVNDIEKENT